MLFSTTSKAAIKSVVYLSNMMKEDKKSSLIEIAEYIQENKHTVGKLLQALVKNNIISSVKGPTGGFFISDDQSKAPIINVVEVFDGKLNFNRCVLGISKCTEKKKCAFHDEFKQAKSTIANLLMKNKITDLHDFSTII